MLTWRVTGLIILNPDSSFAVLFSYVTSYRSRGQRPYVLHVCVLAQCPTLIHVLAQFANHYRLPTFEELILGIKVRVGKKICQDFTQNGL